MPDLAALTRNASMGHVTGNPDPSVYRHGGAVSGPTAILYKVG